MSGRMYALSDGVLAFSNRQYTEEEALQLLQQADLVSIDIETSGLYFNDTILTIGIACTGLSVVLLCGVQPSLWFPFTASPEKIKQYLLAPTNIIGVHSGHFDIPRMARLVPEVRNWIADGRVLDAYLYCRLRISLPSYSLVGIAEELCSLDEKDLQELKRLKQGRNRIQSWEPLVLAQYSSADAVLTHDLCSVLMDRDPMQDHLYLRDMAMLLITTDMICCGVPMDLEALQEKKRWCERQRRKLHTELLTYGIRNPNSRKHLTRAMKVAELGKYFSTSADGLLSITKMDLEQVDHPLPRAIMQWRAMMKIKGWIDSFEKRVTAEGRIHPNLNPSGTVSGRFSCSEPNLQGIPMRRGADFSMAGIFRAPEGKKLYGLDYRQMEFMIATILAQDVNAAYAIVAGDFHTATAKQLFGEEITAEQRYLAKRANFASLYASGPTELARVLNIPFEDADNLLKLHKRTFRRLATAGRYTERLAKERGYVVLYTGRRRYFRKGEELYKAFNQLVQGTVAEIMKTAMIRVYTMLLTSFPQSRMILQIHDAIILELVEEDSAEIIDRATTIMEEALPRCLCNRLDPDVSLEVEAKEW